MFLPLWRKFFSYPPRNFKPELLDLDEAPFDEVQDSLEDIRLVNRYLGGYKVLLHYFFKFFKRHEAGVFLKLN